MSQLGPQGRLTPARWNLSPAPQSSSLRLAWSVIHVADGAASDFPSFRPTDAFLLLLPYFDQYAQSLSLWSPDGRQLVYADVDERQEASVRVLDTTQLNQPTRRLARDFCRVVLALKQTCQALDAKPDRSLPNVEAP
jgi:hypothetical protein